MLSPSSPFCVRCCLLIITNLTFFANQRGIPRFIKSRLVLVIIEGIQALFEDNFVRQNTVLMQTHSLHYVVWCMQPKNKISLQMIKQLESLDHALFMG